MNTLRRSRCTFPDFGKLLAAGVTIALGAGCRSSLPTYPEIDAPASLRVIEERLQGVTTIQASAIVDFEDNRGVRATLDAAVAARPPRLLRLRAWKLDHAVFDATLRDDELWVLPATEGRQENGGKVDSRRAAEGIRRAFFLLTPGFFETAREDFQRTTGERLVVNGVADTDAIRCVIDRVTLTPRHFERVGDEAAPALSIDLEDYRLVGAVPWPHLWTISYPEGRLVIRLGDVVLNCTLPDGAFVPPRRAVRGP